MSAGVSRWIVGLTVAHWSCLNDIRMDSVKRMARNHRCTAVITGGPVCPRDGLEDPGGVVL
ncbi:hypothetical protein IRJ41_007924 [Triplophysa rosa]|uniref:Uncharacterized protein n=1 Tax=Triplophysa rosa TaxID=992332 RepID=A0A9W7WQR0_TRIRA|nr:hypothetical protein IRJ41_007924 [Triplophysa rosa]